MTDVMTMEKPNQNELTKSESLSRNIELEQALRTSEHRRGELAEEVRQLRAALSDRSDHLSRMVEELRRAVAQVQDQSGQLAADRERLDDGWVRLDADRVRLDAGQARLDADRLRLDERRDRLNEDRVRLDEAQDRVDADWGRLDTDRRRLTTEVELLTRAYNDILNLLRTAPTGTIVVDRQLRIRRTNDRAEDLTGLDRDDVGRPIAELSADLGYDDLADMCEQVLRRGVSRKLETRLPHDRWCLLDVAPYWALDHTVDGLVLTLTDVTTLKDREAALLASEANLHATSAKYRTLFESMDEGFGIIEVLFDDGEPVDYRFLEVNPAFEVQTGLADAAGKRIRELRPHHGEYWFRTYGHVALTGEPARFEAPAAEPDNRWYDVYAFRVGSPDERKVAILLSDITDRKQAEAALRESAKRLSALVTATSDAVYRMSPNWREMRELEGRGFLADTDEPSDTWIEKYILPEDQSHVLTVIEEAIRQKSIFELEHRARSADGTVGWTYSRAVPLLNERGEIVEWIGAASDITKRRETEKERERLLAEVERQAAELDAALEAMPDGFVLQGPHGEILRQNRAARRLLHPRDEEALPWDADGVRLLEEDGQPLADRRMLPVPRALRGETVRRMVVGWEPRPDEPVRWFSISAAPVREPQGRITGAVSTVTELTALIQTRQQLEAANAQLEEQAVELEEQAVELEEQAVELQMRSVQLEAQNQALRDLETELRNERTLLQTIYDTVPAMFSIYDARLQTIVLNKHFHEVTGWTEEETDRTNVMDLVYPDPNYRAEVAAYMQSLAPGYKDLTMRGKDGRVIESSWANVQLPDGRQVGIGIDITERKQAEAELKRLNETNRLLLREVNHRVKNNLAAIIALLQIEQTRPGIADDPRYHGFVADLIARVQSLAQVHEAISSGGWGPLPLTSLADQIVTSAMAGMAAQGKLTLNIDDTPVHVTAAQAHHLALALNELATNTLKYGACAEDGHLRVKVHIAQHSHHVELTFSDGGPGFPDDILAGRTPSTGLVVLQTLVQHNLRGSLALRNHGGAVTEIVFPLEVAEDGQS